MIGKIIIAALWIGAILFTGFAVIIIYDLFSEGKSTGGAISLLSGLIAAALLASNGAHIITVLFLSSMGVWFVASIFDPSLRSESDDDYEPEPASSSLGEILVEAVIINQVAHAIDKEIENAKNSNNGPNLHI